MSADNTILIAHFPNGEYRVAEIQNYEDYFDNSYTSAEMVDMKRTYSFLDAPVFKTEDEATLYAEKLEEEIGFVEYGICYATFDRPLVEHQTKAMIEQWWKDNL